VWGPSPAARRGVLQNYVDDSRASRPKRLGFGDLSEFPDPKTEYVEIFLSLFPGCRARAAQPSHLTINLTITLFGFIGSLLLILWVPRRDLRALPSLARWFNHIQHLPVSASPPSPFFFFFITLKPRVE